MSNLDENCEVQFSRDVAHRDMSSYKLSDQQIVRSADLGNA